MKTLKATLLTLEGRMGITEKKPLQCDQHGEYTSLRVGDAWSGCPVCVRERDTAAALVDIQAQRDKRSQRAMERLIGHAAIPERFANSTLDSFEADTPDKQHVLAGCRDYAVCFPEHLAAGRCAFFYGPPGTGKTHLAAAIANHVIREHHLSVVYSTVSELARRFKDNYTTRSTTETAIIAAFAAPDLLILDEVGAGWGSQSELIYLFEVVNARYEQRKPTLFAGNVSRAEVRAAVGDRVADRLNERGGLRFNFRWESERERR